MRADHRAGAFAVQIEIPDVEGFFRLLDFFGILIDGAGESELGCWLAIFQGVVVIFCLDHGKDGAENFFLARGAPWDPRRR